ncbi:MAG: hypothetical protein CVV02_06295 [Firmicutes bacterium HGW-Firmicutes-7]|nr:MAG: hypothetical protein CVV02_06295 [Firmicutes bacterium HGW-Firmicutes-7]
MDVERNQFVTGLSITSFGDQFGRETEIWRGYKEVIVVHKGVGHESDSMRRYSIQEFEELTKVFEQVIASRELDTIERVE